MTQAEWDLVNFFKPHEFDSKNQPGSGFNNMKYEFVKQLDQLRARWGRINVTSGYRSPEHNTAVGGVKDSSHTRGYAADLATDNLEDAIKLAIVAARVGFVRIGVDLKGKLVHVDSDPSLPQQVTWFYHNDAPRLG